MLSDNGTAMRRTRKNHKAVPSPTAAAANKTTRTARDGADLVHSSDVTGYPDIAHKLLDSFALSQKPDGNFPSQPHHSDGSGEPVRGYSQHSRMPHDKAFAEWALPGHTDIMNPVDSIIAAVRYANDRYGSFDVIAYTTWRDTIRGRRELPDRSTGFMLIS